MFGYDTIVLLGFFIGMILYAVLFVEVIKRQNKLEHEYVFLTLVALLMFWHGFQFFALLIREVFGRQSLEVYMKFRYAALYSIAFFPAVTVHLHSAFLDYVHRLVGRKIFAYRILPLFFYLPVFVILYFGQYTIIDARQSMLAENMSFIPAFVFWVIICLGMVAILCVRIIMLSRNEKWKQFFMLETVIILFIAGLLIYFYFFGGTGNVRLDKSLKRLLTLSSVIPTFAMIYLLYKYPFYSTVARRRFLLITISGAFLTIFIMASKTLHQMTEENPNINIEMLQILLVASLFILYEPAKYLIRRVAGYYALSQKFEYQSLMRKLSERIVSATNLADLFKILRAGVVETLDTEEAALFILAKHGAADDHPYSVVQSFGDIKEFKLKSVIKTVQKSSGIYDARRMNIFHLKSSEIPYQIYVGIMLDNDLVGLLAIGKKKTNEDFTFEEKELLLTLASQTAIAIENIELVQRRIELESKMFQADKLSSLGMLSTSIAHEVKNPLSSIKSIVQAMKNEKMKKNTGDAEIQDLQIIDEEIDRLTAVVSQLLKFARPDNSELDEIDVIRIIDTILTILRQEMRGKGIAIYTKYDHTPLMIKSRQGDLKEIIFNIIINAVQSMEQGGQLMFHGCYVLHDADYFEDNADEKKVAIFDKLYAEELAGYSEWRMEPVMAQTIGRIEKKMEPGDALKTEAGKISCIKIAITDSGPGIPEERLQEIFKPFYTTKPTGTGLGLAIVKNKIEALGGRLVLRSQESVGTSFEIYIPVQTKN
jgi:signal transduction histidine kinase